MTMRTRLGSDRGAAWVFVAAFMPLAVILTTFAVDVPHWFDYDRSLQARADAAALAGGGVYGNTCFRSEPSATDLELIGKTAERYSGPPVPEDESDLVYGPAGISTIKTDPAEPDYFNQPRLKAGTADQFHLRLNSAQYWDSGANFDMGVDDDSGTEKAFCNSVDEEGDQGPMLDVKLTQANLPLFVPIPFTDVDRINAHARVELRRQTMSNGGGLPLAVPDLVPRFVFATFVDDANPASFLSSCPNDCTVELFPVRDADGDPVRDEQTGAILWRSAFDGLMVPIDRPGISVRIKIIEGNDRNAACGTALVTCLDEQSGKGLVYIRGWQDGDATTGPPVARDVRLLPGDCNADAYFTRVPCGAGIEADVDFGDRDISGNNARVTARAGGSTYELSKPTSGTTWTTSNIGISVVGPNPVYLDWQWEDTSGTWRGLTCAAGKTNPCKGNGSFGQVQSSFLGDPSRTPGVRLARIGVNGGADAGANSFETGTPQPLYVTLGVSAIQNADRFDDPTVILRFASGSGSDNYVIDCGPGSLYDQIVTGCSDPFQLNTTLTCPKVPPLSPPDCAPINAIGSGDKLGQLRRAMDDRFGCPANNWVDPGDNSLPSIASDDPRLVRLIVTTWKSFEGSGGNREVPVAVFASFYVTGWDGQGQPCIHNERYPDHPAKPHGDIWGHFVRIAEPSGTGGGSDDLCDTNPETLGNCIAVLTR